MFKNWCDFRQLSSFAANISRKNKDIYMRQRALSSAINRALN